MSNVSRKLAINLSLRKIQRAKNPKFFEKPADVEKIRLKGLFLRI